MIDSASPELCKTLYELSGWEPSPGVTKGDNHWPAYNLGYLLRKLPEQVELKSYFDGSWDCRHIDTDEAWGVNGRMNGDTPEDATAKLAIELFKQGILKADNQSED